MDSGVGCPTRLCCGGWNFVGGAARGVGAGHGPGATGAAGLRVGGAFGVHGCWVLGIGY